MGACRCHRFLSVAERCGFLVLPSDGANFNIGKAKGMDRHHGHQCPPRTQLTTSCRLMQAFNRTLPPHCRRNHCYMVHRTVSPLLVNVHRIRIGWQPVSCANNLQRSFPNALAITGFTRACSTDGSIRTTLHAVHRDQLEFPDRLTAYFLRSRVRFWLRKVLLHRLPII